MNDDIEYLNDIETALLGLLCEGPKHPYEIEKSIESHQMREWTEISMSSVYKVLQKMEKKELVSSQVQLNEKNRSQKIYTVTEKGHITMTEKVKNLLSKWEKSIWPIDLAIHNLSLIDKKEAVLCIKKYIVSIDDSIKKYKALKEYLENNCQISNVSHAKRPLYLLEAEKKWAREFIIDLEK